MRGPAGGQTETSVEKRQGSSQWAKQPQIRNQVHAAIADNDVVVATGPPTTGAPLSPSQDPVPSLAVSPGAREIKSRHHGTRAGGWGRSVRAACARMCCNFGPRGHWTNALC